jgi:hypothetical protein
MIVVGNPKVLSKDKKWEFLIEYCIKNSSYKGVYFKKNI